MIHGYNYKTIKKELLYGGSCPNCGAKNELELQVLVKVNHIMFIPLFPEKKRVVVNCAVCNTKFSLQSFPQFVSEGEALKMNTRNKWYHYLGLFFFIVFATGVAILVINGNRETKKRLRSDVGNLRSGSSVFYKIEKNRETSFRVKEIIGDTIWVFENTLSTNENVRKLDEDENYSTEETFYVKPALTKLVEDGTIIDIDL